MITAITRDTARMIDARIADAIRDLGDELGVEIKTAGFRYGGNKVCVAVEASLDMPLEETSEGRMFKMLARRYGMEPDMLGKTIWVGGDLFKITGIKTSRPKFPISGERVKDGKSYKFTVHQVLAALPSRAA